MKRKTFIKKLRPYPKKRALQRDILLALLTILLGAGMGLIAKMTDSISLIGEIGTELGIWIFTATLVCAFSRYPLSAAINVLLFFLSMLAAYYIYGYIELGFFPRTYFMGWLILSVLAAFAGFFLWFSRAKGIVGSIMTALPVALLFADGYSAVYTLRFTSFLSLIMGVLLCLLLPRKGKFKFAALCIAAPLAFLIVRLDLFRFLP